ncbi:MAG: hypothetical protein ACI84R_003662 [Candidatus Azotimanducaceae bacterium]|jgi:hypothetical protein
MEVKDGYIAALMKERVPQDQSIGLLIPEV